MRPGTREGGGLCGGGAGRARLGGLAERRRTRREAAAPHSTSQRCTHAACTGTGLEPTLAFLGFEASLLSHPQGSEHPGLATHALRRHGAADKAGTGGAAAGRVAQQQADEARASPFHWPGRRWGRGDKSVGGCHPSRDQQLRQVLVQAVEEAARVVCCFRVHKQQQLRRLHFLSDAQPLAPLPLAVPAPAVARDCACVAARQPAQQHCRWRGAGRGRQRWCEAAGLQPHRVPVVHRRPQATRLRRPAPARPLDRSRRQGHPLSLQTGPRRSSPRRACLRMCAQGMGRHGGGLGARQTRRPRAPPAGGVAQHFSK